MAAPYLFPVEAFAHALNVDLLMTAAKSRSEQTNFHPLKLWL